MSMPSFPPCGANMTKDEALTMIIASIAMEELALSHIVNAEGEKLQYLLGTLPGRPGPCATPQEILAVNRSVNELLNTVMQSQMLLKGKLEKALEAGSPVPPPTPGPSGPCAPPCTGCGPCCPKSAIQLRSRCGGLSWERDHLLSWKCQGHTGCSIAWDEKKPAQVSLAPGKTYALDYTINICSPCPEDGEGAVLVRLTPYDTFSGVLPLYFSGKRLERRSFTLHYSTVLFPQKQPAGCASLSLLLHYGGSLLVDQAILNLMEL